MAKQLNVNLAFNANTSQAKQSILELQKTLQQISSQPITVNNQSIQESISAAKQLSYHLNAAFNTSTGNLDLNAFNSSLKRSNTNVTTLSTNLLRSGEIGQQAFIQLAQAISQAEFPMLRVNSRLTEMWTTMKNTARWQLSSSVLHGFIGAIQKAHGYAKDLNESLNNIRIVTGYGVEEMAQFAKEANKAARTLQTTTTEYTNASLIYYQQGLSKEEVLERTNVTMKMANVSRQSAEVVSDQMTAVWNNFYDGSKSLEYYADVMTALGAATASSTDEISEGLNKFAAIADTVGLSYEYAASALATVTATTRQSADVVGTAFKTLFARIQDLELGETLDDGTTLGKYSEALKVVGIDIKDISGDMKDMDQILDELGSKWSTISKDTQVALAQTVAGTRQYTQLVALMDNWDYFKENLNVATGSTGTLSKQAAIYEENWEAASKRVQASLEGIYQQLLDDSFFIDFNNGLAEALGGIEKFIDSIGGIKGVITSIGTFVLSLVANKIEPALRNTIQNITVLFTGARAQIQKLTNEMASISEKQVQGGNYNTAQQQALTNARQLMAARQQLSIASKDMTEQEARMAEYTLQGLTVQQEQAQAIADDIVQLQDQKQTLLDTAAAVNLNTEAQRAYSSTLRILHAEEAAARQAYMQDDGSDLDNKINAYHQARAATEFYEAAQTDLTYSLEMSTNAILDNYNALDDQKANMSDISSSVIAPFISQITDLGKTLSSNTQAFGSETQTLMAYADALHLVQRGMPTVISQNEKVKAAFNKAFDARTPKEFVKVITSSLVPELKKVGLSAEQIKQALKQLDGKKFKELENNANLLAKKEQELLNIQKQLNAAFAQFNPSHMVSSIERVVASAAALGQISMIVTSIKSAFDALNSESDMSFGQRLTAILMSVSMLVPAVIGSFKNLGKAIQGTTLETWLYSKALKKEKLSQEEIIAITTLKTAMQKGEAGQATALAAVKALVISSLKKEGIVLNEAAKAQFEKIVADQLAQGADLKTAITKALVTLRTNTNRQAVTAETAAKVANKVATDALNVSLKSLLGPIGLIIAAIGIVISLFTAWSEKQKKLAEARAEDAAAAREQVDSLKEETNAVKDLYDAYLTAKGTLDGSQSSKDALRSATEELCKALGVEWDALDKLQEKYEDVNEEILKTQLLSLEAAAKEAQESKNKNEATYRDAVSNAGDIGLRNEGYSTDSDGKLELILPGGVSPTDESVVRDALNKWIAEEGLSDQLTSLWYDPSGSLFEEDEYHLTTDGSLSKEQLAEYMYQFYEHLYSGNAGISNDVLEESEIAQWFKDLGKKMKDEREGVQEAEDYLNELIPQIAEKRAQLSLPGLLENIETEEDYEKYRAQYIQTLEEAYKEFGKEVPQDLATVADNYFAQYDFLKPVVETSQYLEGIREKLKANGETDAAIEEFITHLKENNLVEVVAQVITDNSTIDSLNSSMNAIQKLADSKQLIIRWNILSTAKSDLKDNMTTKEYQTWLNKYSKDLFGESGMLGGMSAETFSSLSYTQQKNALTNAYDYTNMDQVYDNAIASQQTLLDNEKNNAPELKQISVIQTYEKNIADLQAEQKLVAQSQLTNRFESASSLGDIYAARDFGIDNEVDINYDVYAEALTRVASAYGNCADEMARYQTILLQSKEENSTITEDQIAQAQANLEASIVVGELAKAHNLNAEAIERYADELASSGKYSKANQKALVGMAKDQLRFDRAVNTTISNMEDWIKDLEVAKKTGHLVSETAEEMASAYGDLLDMDGSDLSADFLKNQTNFENLKKALEGDEAAYRALQEAARKDIAVNIGINDEEFQTDFANLMAQCQMGSLPDLEVGASLNNQDFLNGLSEMVNKAGMTAEQATNYLSAMGVDAEVITEPETVKEVQGYNLVATPGTEQIQYNPGAHAGGTAVASYPTVTYTPQPVYTERTVTGTALKITSASKSAGGDIKFKGSTVAHGGSSSKSAKTAKAESVKPTKKSDVVERYKEVTDKIDDVQNAMNDASKAADRLWGPARLKQLEKQNKLIQDEVKLLKQKKKEAQANLIKDRSDLSKAAAAAGVSFNIDEKGNITNYTEKMNALYAELESRENEANGFVKAGKSKEKQDEYIKKYVTPLQDKINELKEAMSQYEKTRELLEDIDDQIDDKWNAWQDNNYKQLTYKLELKIEINDRDLKEIEYYLNKVADDFYQMAESAALLVQGNSELNPGKSKLDVYNENYETDNDHLNDLNNQYNTFNEDGIRNISQKDYAAGLKEIHSNALADAQALKELDDTMLDYYGNTLAMAGEELAKYTDRMEHQTAILEHYRSIMDIIGKSTDYESMGVILEGQAKTIENELAVAQGNYEMLAGEADYWKQMMDSVDETDPAFAVYKANWEAAESAAREAQDNMLAKTEEWAKAMKAVLENKLAGLAQTLENALTGGTSFDTITTQMERAASLQEEYLTTTNKIYETNKMINTAQQAIDKTTNTVAKQKLKSFQQETAQLQNKKKLSQYELEIQQAKYDLLLAEIALEEAQQAKSTVRLQRDSEGNFGYIYTADANELADAEQKLADAQNNLYNIGLEGANNYVQKYQETMREMYDTLTDIQTRYLNGEFESEEEYHQAMEEAKEYYYQKLQDYSSLYQVSLTTDSRVVKDAWSTDFAGMTQNTESWKISVNRYVGEVEQAFKQWDQTVQSIKNYTVGKNLDELNTKVGNIVTESNNLTTAITKDGGLLDALQSEITEVGNVALKYASVRGEVQGLILEYEELAEKAKIAYNSIDFEENDDDKDDTPPGVKGTTGEDKNPSTVGVDKGNGDPDNVVEETSTTYLTSDSSPVTVYTNLGRGTSTKIAGNRLYHKGTISPNTTQYSGYTFYEVFYDQAGIAYPGYLLRKDYADLKQKASSFDTGGYTGSWGSEGKMAMLHEKELILNANDTTNFLASLEVLREIVNTINLHSMNAQLGGLLSTPHWIGTDQSQILEQQVHIEASFPGVQDRNEIEEAFNNLINRASQFVNRK